MNAKGAFRAFRALGSAFSAASRPATFARAWRPTQQASSQRWVHHTPRSNVHFGGRRIWQTRFEQARSWQQQQTRGYRQQLFNRGRVMASGLLFRRWAQRPTFYYEVSGLAGVCGIYYIYNLETVPVSGRRRFNCISEEWEEWLGLQQLESLLQEYQGRILPEMSREHQMAVRVMERLVPFSGLADKDWEVRVIQDDEQKNAFVLPGGKVFIFTGILQYCKDEDGLAAVLGHEIAHNVAHHAAERTSQFMVLAPIGAIVVLAGGVDYSVWRLVTNLAFTLPGSRQQEEEADYIGLLMMAQGCYNPQAALRLWASMEQAEKGREPPQMLSTHPSHHSRLERIQSWLGEANDKREMSDCAATAWHMDRFRQTADFQRW